MNNQSSSPNSNAFKNSLKNSNMFFSLVICYKTLTNYLYYSNLGQSILAGAYLVMKSIKALLTNKTIFYLDSKQTIGWNSESIGYFGLTASQPSKTVFKLFQKHLSIKQLVVSTKQQVVFHLVWKTL